MAGGRGGMIPGGVRMGGGGRYGVRGGGGAAPGGRHGTGVHCAMGATEFHLKWPIMSRIIAL
jgi:hypothetical protein